jgi:hypothetical protein
VSDLIFVEQKPMAGKEHIPQPGTTIGREGSDINIADPEVSRRHATIRSEGGAVAIEDLNSTNGTFVNGERITGTRVLSEGDEVRFGMTVWKLQPSAQKTAIADAPAAPAPPQVTAARQVPADLPPQAPQQPPAPTPPAPQPPAPAPPQPAAAPPTAQQPAAPRPPAPAPPAPGGAPAGQRGDVPAPDFQPSAIRRVVPPPGAPAAFHPVAPARGRGSAATRVGATVAAGLVVLATAAAVVAYYVIEPFQPTKGDPDVAATFQEFADAVADGDGDAACDVLSDDAAEQFAEGQQATDCEAAVEGFDEDLQDDFGDIEPDEIEVDGDRATVTGEAGDVELDLELERQDGDWQITDLG